MSVYWSMLSIRGGLRRAFLACVLAGGAAYAQQTVQAAASLSGSVMDEDGALLPGAQVQITSGTVTMVTITDSDAEFHFSGLPAGPYTLHVADSGFLAVDEHGSLFTGEEGTLPPVELRGRTVTAIDVVASMHDIAAEQVREETKQRVLGVIPNFYVVYHPNPAPLTTRQKFYLAERSTLDPVNFAGVAVGAGIEQASGSVDGWGYNFKGYAQRYGANFADGSIATFLGGAVLPSIFGQDPRYFYQGTGTTASRMKHALASPFICRSDKGVREFNYSNVLGNFASAGISNTYYPAAAKHGAGLTLTNAAIGTAFGMFGAVMQEFVVPRFTTHRHGAKTPMP